jgi:hypothetical protein
MTIRAVTNIIKRDTEVKFKDENKFFHAYRKSTTMPVPTQDSTMLECISTDVKQLSEQAN